MSLSDRLRFAIHLRNQRRRLPSRGGDQFGEANILITEDGQPILTEENVASGDEYALEREGD